MKFPPQTNKEFESWLKYQKEELLALPLVPIKIIVNDKIIKIPEELREEIAKTDNFIYEIRPLLAQFLREDYYPDLLASDDQFEWSYL